MPPGGLIGIVFTHMIFIYLFFLDEIGNAQLQLKTLIVSRKHAQCWARFPKC